MKRFYQSGSQAGAAFRIYLRGRRVDSYYAGVPREEKEWNVKQHPIIRRSY
jgi:hypothetical protein